MRHALITAISLALLAGCGAGGTEHTGVEPEPSVTQQAEWEREYHSPEDIIEALRDSGIECETDGDAAATIVSLRAQGCYVDEELVEGYGIDVYGSAAQQNEARAHFAEETSWAGTTFVWGKGWSVSVPFESDGSEVVDVIGGAVESG